MGGGFFGRHPRHPNSTRHSFGWRTGTGTGCCCGMGGGVVGQPRGQFGANGIRGGIGIRGGRRRRVSSFTGRRHDAPSLALLTSSSRSRVGVVFVAFNVVGVASRGWNHHHHWCCWCCGWRWYGRTRQSSRNGSSALHGIFGGRRRHVRSSGTCGTG